MNTSVYQVITDRVLSLLEKGTIPWQQPWKSADQAPRNLVSKRPYRGINLFLLHSMCYSSPYWLTYNQANSLGGHVKKGERGCPVVFWKPLDVAAPQEPSGKKTVPFLRYFCVFNVTQCQDIPESKIPTITENSRTHSPIEEAERIVSAMPKKPGIQHHGARACYIPSLDRVEMPEPGTFRTPQDYYSVMFHELTHSTGHETRLNRKGVGGSAGEWSSFGSTPYANEELVAEMGAAFLCGEAGILNRTIENSASYVASWLARLKSDPKLVVQAASHAQKAADFILGLQATQLEDNQGSHQE